MAAEAVIFLFLEFAVFKKRNFFTEEVSFFFFRHTLWRECCTFAPEVRGQNPFIVKFCLYIHFFTYQIFIRFCLLAFDLMIMVRRVIYLIVAAALFAGCTCREDIRADLPGKVKFSFVLDCDVFTKAVEGDVISDFNLYVFNMAGDVVSSGFFTGGGEAVLDIWCGETCSVYVVANAGRRIMVHSVQELEGMSLDVSGGGMILSGKLPPKVLEDGERVVIPLTRAFSRIMVKTDYAGLDSGVSIDIKRIALRNVPQRVQLFGSSAFGDAALFASGGSVENPSAGDLEQGVAFYQYENMQGTLQPGNTDQTKKVWPAESNWAKVCSYVEMEAEYASESLAGEIIYRFYLGSDMVANYDVQRNREYVITVSFKGNGGADETSWRVDNSGLEDMVPPEISFVESTVPMYDLEERELRFSRLDTRGGEVSIESSDPSVLQVLEWNGEYVKVKALAPGKATVVASVKGVSASCSVEVEKLRLEPRLQSVTLFNHFYEDIPYDIYPPHAAGLGVKVSSAVTSLVAGFGGVANRVIPQYGIGTGYPVQEKVRLSIVGRDDVSAEVALNVMPMISMQQEVIVNANMGNSVTRKPLGLETSPRADIGFEWVPSDGETIYGTPPESVSCSREFITVNVPTQANGRYRLKASVVGDDGYGTTVAAQQEAVAYSDLLLYETVYLVGISKSMNRERIAQDPDVWRYENEVVAKWLAHPESLIFPEGEVDLNMSFIYKGVEYSDNYTEFNEQYEFEFIKGERYEYSMGNGSFVYNGTAPRSYYEYFYLQPVSSPYIEGSLPDNQPYIYVCSRYFAGGFCQEGMPNWKSVFEYIYPER